MFNFQPATDESDLHGSAPVPVLAFVTHPLRGNPLTSMDYIWSVKWQYLSAVFGISRLDHSLCKVAFVMHEFFEGLFDPYTLWSFFFPFQIRVTSAA